MTRRPDVDTMLTALGEAAELGEGRVGEAELEAMRRIAGRARERRALSADHTVVGFFGATGSGKSTLFNAVVGEQLARAHVRRPTTSEPLAAVWGPHGATPLLDWLEVHDRRVVERPFAGNGDLSLVLLDLPDFDSVEASHRAIAERLAGQVDVLVWVVDPQKYADAVIHRDFIAPLHAHASVTAAVLNQIDLLAPADVPHVVESLTQLLRRDGLDRVRVLPVSARTGEGVDALTQVIARFAAERHAQTSRLAADIRSLAERLEATGVPGPVAKADARALERGLGAAAGVDLVANAVASSYRKRAGQVTGWPLTAWLLRLAPDPLRRLHLPFRQRERDSELHRTALPPFSAAQRAQVGRAVRGYTEAAAAGVGPGWTAAFHERSAEAIETLPAELDRAVARTDLGAGPSWWWPLFAALQWIALIAAIVGGLWLLLPVVLPLFGMLAPVLPQVTGTATWFDGWPVPLLLLAAGVLLGIVLGLLGSVIGGAVGAARRRRARRRLQAQVDAVAREIVVAPVEAERQRAVAFADAVERARGASGRR